MRIKVKYAGPETILKLSSGQVTEPGTLTFPDMETIKGGLHCQKIFGPVKDDKCACKEEEGGVKGKQHRGVICERCGVKVEPAKARRERFGHITFPFYLINPLAKDSLAELIGINFMMMPAILQGELYFGWVPNTKGTHIVRIGSERCKVKFETSSRPEENITFRAVDSLYKLVSYIDVEETIVQSSSKKIQSAFFNLVRHEIKPTDLFIKHLPVLPADYRPVINVKKHKGENKEDKTSKVDDPRNAHYQRLIWKINRYYRLGEFVTPPRLILEEEQINLQKSLDQLFFGGTRFKKKQIDGLLDKIKGKAGLLRKNLLGKRVDYSGRSIISPDPTLALDEVRLPVKMAYNLFAIHIQKELIDKGILSRKAMSMYDRHHSLCYKILRRIAPGRRVILNRQPTLHKIGMMAFKIILHDGHSIKLPPLVCTPFNADFDGDQMAVYLPLREATELEVIEKMSPEKNLLSPLNSELAMSPSHEMIIGAFYMTNYVEKDKIWQYGSNEQALRLYDLDILPVNELIIIRKNGKIHFTCIGRILFENLFKIPVTEPFSKKYLRAFLTEAYETLTIDEYLRALKELQELTFKYATKWGFSLGMDDFKSPSNKEKLFGDAEKFVEEQNKKEKSGLITEQERYGSIIKCWKDTFDEADKQWIEEADVNNPLVVMYKTGSRVSLAQVSQLIVAKGLQTNASGYIFETPVQACLKDRLDTGSFFRSCTGARKAMYDKKNATPQSGYLARRLVNAARDFYISEEDCGFSREGIILPSSKVVGRTSLDGHLINEDEPDIPIAVRSPIFCKAKKGICATCYGIDPSTRTIVKKGSAIGVIAAQSLTEPTTQMTMRTFHTSGAVELGKSPRTIKAATSGVVRLEEGNRLTEIWVDDNKYIVINEFAIIAVKDGDNVQSGQPLAGYVEHDIKNEDISGALTVIERYYEMSNPKSVPALVAQTSGRVRLQITEEGAISVLIGDEHQGVAYENPVLVHDREYVYKGQFLTPGEINPRKIDTDDLSLQATIFVNRLLQIYSQEGVSSNPVHLEVIFRALSEFIKTDDGYELLRYGAVGDRCLLGADEVGRFYPSWLKILCFGYTRSTLAHTAIHPRMTYDLPSERLLVGQMPLFGPLKLRREL